MRKRFLQVDSQYLEKREKERLFNGNKRAKGENNVTDYDLNKQ